MGESVSCPAVGVAKENPLRYPSVGGQGIVRKEGVMKLADESPSFWNVRTSLLSSLDFAEDFARNCRDHAADVAHFTDELRRHKKDLMTSFESDIVPAPLQDIVNGLMDARVMASMMAERHPKKSGPLTQFVDGLEHAQTEFMGKVRLPAKDCP